MFQLILSVLFLSRLTVIGPVSVDLDSRIIFPDSELYNPYLYETPKCSEGKTICEDIDSYPYELLNYAKEELSEYKDLFGQDEVPIDAVSRDDDEQFVCPYSSRVIFPKVGKTKSEKWKYIVNQDSNEEYVQGVLVEFCQSENDSCRIIGDMPYNGYTTSCKQKYIYRRMLSLDEDLKPVPDEFLIPSACCCAYTKTYNFFPNLF